MKSPKILYTLARRIRLGDYPTLETLQSHLEEQEESISIRSLERYIKILREDYKQNIEYSFTHKGYYFEDSSNSDSDDLMKFLELIYQAKVLSEAAYDEAYIDFDYHGLQQGTEWIKPILQAIRDQRVISFSHENYGRKERSDHRLKPALLKQYQGIWYVFGELENFGLTRTFALDRIHNLKVSNEHFDDPIQNPKKLFENTIGLVYSDDQGQPIDVEEVVIWAPTFRAKYIKALPWHASQRVQSEDDEGSYFTMRITPNLELKQKLLQHCAEVKVMEPQWLREEVKAVLEKAREALD